MTIKPIDRGYMKMACDNAVYSNDPKCKVGVVVAYTETKQIREDKYDCECQCFYWEKYHDKEDTYETVTLNTYMRNTGFNTLTFPHGFPDKLCQMILNNPEMKSIITTHAEQNLLGFKGNHRKFKDTENATLYTTKFPCLECADIIVSANIKRVVTARIYEGSKWGEVQNRALTLFEERGVQVEYIDIEMKNSFPSMIELQMNLKREGV